jgi:hypothetical protein
MIGGGAFLLLKTGSNGPESSEQAEIPLAGSATILAFGFPRGLGSVAQKPRRSENCSQRLKRCRIPPIMANASNFAFLLFRSQY